jgi:hypothetical protein
MFIVQCTNDKIWNQVELVRFLNANQHKSITLTINPEAICLHNLKLYDLLDCFEFSKVTIVTRNLLEQHDVYDIVPRWSNPFLSEIVTNVQSTWHWTQQKRFLTLYGRPTANRLGIASHLFAHHRDTSHLHFSSCTDDDSLRFYELDKLLEYDIDSIKNVAKMLPNMPLTQLTQGYDPKRYNFKDSLTDLYKDILIDIVSESHVLGTTFFPTEKTTRPMWCKKPFVIFGSCNYLEYLRQLGFKTFNEFWDEDYDGYEAADRLKKIYQLIDQLASISIQELNSLYQHMQPILEHNYSLLINQTYNKNIKLICD